MRVNSHEINGNIVPEAALESARLQRAAARREFLNGPSPAEPASMIAPPADYSLDQLVTDYARAIERVDSAGRNFRLALGGVLIFAFALAVVLFIRAP
jgi:hypothetical protein